MYSARQKQEGQEGKRGRELAKPQKRSVIARDERA